MDYIIDQYLFKEQWKSRSEIYDKKDLKLVKKAYYKKKINSTYYASMCYFGVIKDASLLKPGHKERCFEYACDGGNMEIIKQLSPSIEFTEENMKYAFKNGNLKIVTWFMETYALDSEKWQLFRVIQNTFNEVCRHGYIEILKITRKWITSDDVIVTVGLYDAYRNKHMDVVEWLIESFKIGTHYLIGTGYDKFLSSGDPDDIYWLINRFGKNYIRQKANVHDSIFHCCQNGFLKSAQTIYHQFKLNPDNFLYNRGNGCLIQSAINCHRDVVDWLLSIQGTNVIKNHSYEVIRKCLLEDNIPMAKYLLEQYDSHSTKKKLSNGSHYLINTCLSHNGKIRNII